MLDHQERNERRGRTRTKTITNDNDPSECVQITEMHPNLRHCLRVMMMMEVATEGARRTKNNRQQHNTHRTPLNHFLHKLYVLTSSICPLLYTYPTHSTNMSHDEVSSKPLHSQLTTGRVHPPRGARVGGRHARSAGRRREPLAAHHVQRQV